MPLPRMLLIASATMLQRPMARISRGCGARWRSAVIAPLYHKAGGARLKRWARRTDFMLPPHLYRVEESEVRYSYATHLECSVTGERYDIARLQGLSAAKKPLLGRYDLEALKREVAREEIMSRPSGLWRWHELLPIPAPSHVISLGEVETPLIPLTNSARP